jgi:radical SAM protein with 4Fe4S-binding SPASM domain
MIKRRQEIEAEYFANLDKDDILASISSIDITTIDLCNRDCVFCPRHDPQVYPNRNLYMTAEGAAILGQKISTLDYTGTIAISGFGENLLNPEILGIVKELRKTNPKAYIEANTNGDPLDLEMFDQLRANGLNMLNINVYDGPEQIDQFDEMLQKAEGYRYRVHYNPDDYGIIFNNRSGLIDWIPSEPKDVAGSPCYMPFYKLMIDWNGDVLFCANDWGRERIVGNLFQQSIMDVWMSKEMLKVRMRLSKGNRNFSPCKTCNVKGTLVGEPSFKLLMEHYNADSSNRQ